MVPKFQFEVFSIRSETRLINLLTEMKVGIPEQSEQPIPVQTEQF
jgi:hypothetical protein